MQTAGHGQLPTMDRGSTLAAVPEGQKSVKTTPIAEPQMIGYNGGQMTIGPVMCQRCHHLSADAPPGQAGAVGTNGNSSGS